MNTDIKYWFFKKALTDKNCSDILELVKSNELQLGLTGKQKSLKNKNKLSKKQIKDLKKTRNSNILFKNDPWLYRLITPYVDIANKNAGWNYEISWYESFQITSYKKKQHYGWHQDCWSEPYKSEDPNFNNKIRKLSVICSLMDSKDYTGGKVEFFTPDPNLKNGGTIYEVKELKEKGTIIVFPSHIFHKVNLVTKGHRCSLVLWGLGYPFK